MNKDDIIRMAREAGLKAANYPSMIPDSEWETLGKFVALVAAHERERILEICKEGLWDAGGIREHIERGEQ